MQLSPTHLALAMLFGSIAAFLAWKRKKNPYLWFALGFFFGMLGVFALFFAPLSKKRRNSRRLSPPKPIFTMPGPADKFWYYLGANDEQIGPVSHSAVAKAFLSGEISKGTYVWHEDLVDWKKLEELGV